MVWTRGDAASRAVEAMLRSLGGGPVRVRIACTSEETRGLGLTAGTFEDVDAGPALIHLDDQGTPELLVGAEGMRKLSEGRGSIEGVCANIAGVVHGERLRPAISFIADSFAGADCLYRFRLKE